MNHRIVFLLAVASIPTVAVAQETEKYQCTYGELQRRVEVAHEPGVEVPCSVHYFKDTENPGEQQVLWTAERDAVYCRSKAAELVAKLEGWGWDCGRGSDTGADDADEVVKPDDNPDEMLGDPDTATPTAETDND